MTSDRALESFSALMAASTLVHGIKTGAMARALCAGLTVAPIQATGSTIGVRAQANIHGSVANTMKASGRMASDMAKA